MSLTPQDLQQFLSAEQIEAHLIHDIGETPTVPAAAQALGVEPSQIIKTLLFLVERPGTDNGPEPVVVISNGESHVDKRPLADHFGVGKKRIKLAPPDIVLDLLGYPAGGVPPFGHRARFPVILDTAVITAAARFDGCIFGGGGDDRTMMKLTVHDLCRATQPTLLAVS